MRQENLSPSFTTRWGELPLAKMESVVSFGQYDRYQARLSIIKALTP